MAYTKILNIAHDLATELKQSPTYLELKRLDDLIKTKYGDLLKEYKKTFHKFEVVFNEGGTYHPDFKSVSAAYILAKEALFKKEEVKLYFENEKKMNKYLKDLSDEIKVSISSYNDYKGGICPWK